MLRIGSKYFGIERSISSDWRPMRVHYNSMSSYGYMDIGEWSSVDYWQNFDARFYDYNLLGTDKGVQEEYCKRLKDFMDHKGWFNRIVEANILSPDKVSWTRVIWILNRPNYRVWKIWDIIRHYYWAALCVPLNFISGINWRLTKKWRVRRADKIYKQFCADFKKSQKKKEG